ncbi:conserved hypothetical protein [Photobacterium leiognathi lrivu.4.1]|uniref:Peptidase S24/S26A/S26B/S26C domain-containing protein n=1 Tax=Photobacterium leiognathi lrivu.4.1 TaxID=1248232 RepID=V5F8N3_PHOLE|nr:hypothetical protein [Photobacterium leiognathi]GAD31769.1 conserved hypothetical protein [Photobacterium leiognathi lrivu.4.1]
MAAFPSPAKGYEEQPIGDTITEHLIPKPSSTITVKADEYNDYLGLNNGDLLVVELDRRPHDGCTALVEQDGDIFFDKLFWRKGKWYISTGERAGVVTENMTLKGVATFVVNDQL